MSNPIPYDPNIPENFSDSLDISQPDFLNNFQVLFNTFLTNHVSLDSSISPGQHTIVQMNERTQTTPPQTNTGEISIYAADAAGQTDQVYLKYQGSSAPFQYTNYQIYPCPTVPHQTMFFTFLPGRILVYFGQVTLGSQSTSGIFFRPPIAKKIITVSACAVGTYNANNSPYKPKVSPIQNGNGIFDGMLITYRTGLSPNILTNFIVMANI